MVIRCRNIWIVIMAFLLAGCATAGEMPAPSLTGIPTNTVTQIFPQPSATKTKTPTQTPTSTPTIKATEISSAPTPTSTQTPLIRLPAIQGDVSDYQLSPAKPGNLILIQRKFSLDFQQISWSTYHALNAIFDESTLFEWQRVYYPEINSLALFELLPEWFEEGWVSNFILNDVIGDFLTRYFSDNKIIFEDETGIEIPEYDIYAFSRKIELDGDESAEWLITIDDPTRMGKSTLLLTLDQHEDGHYTRINNRLPVLSGYPLFENPDYQIRDLNGDGETDLAIEEIICGFGECFERYHIILGQEDGYTYIKSSAVGRGGGTNRSKSDWRISSENNLPLLEITTDRALLPWECNISNRKTFQWIGYTERVTEFPISYVDSATCTIARAMDKTDSPDRKSQIQFLNLAYNQKDGLSEEYKVFVLYRLALLHALEGEDWAARKYLGILSEIATKGSVPVAAALYQEIVPLLQKNQVHPYKLCMAAENIYQQDDANWNALLGFSTYPYQGFLDGYPAPLCDTRDIHLGALNAVDMQATVNLKDALLQAGIPVGLAVSFENSAAPSAWILAIEDFDPEYNLAYGRESGEMIYLYGYTEDQGWFDLDEIYLPIDRIQIVAKDITGDGITDLALTVIDHESSACVDQDMYYFEMITTQIFDKLLTYESGNVEFACYPKDQKVAIEELLKDGNGDGIIDWVSDHLEDQAYVVSLLAQMDVGKPWLIHDSTRINSDLDPLVYMPTILEELYSEIDQSTNYESLRDKIVFYRERWGAQDEIGRNIRAQINYLLALTYEMQGDENQAVEIFYQIWNDFPETIWALLAANRLEYVQP